jgi:ribosome-binding factor A
MSSPEETGASPMTTRKLEHLNERVRHKLGTILERESNDPRFRHVTVTGVRLSKDLSHARVTFTTHDALVPPAPRPKAAPGTPRTMAAPGAPRAKAAKGRKPKASGAGHIPSLTKALNQAAGFFSHSVARSLETRISPRLTFVFDPSLDYLQDMENVLKPLRAAGQMGDPDRPTGAAETGAEAASEADADAG